MWKDQYRALISTLIGQFVYLVSAGNSKLYTHKLCLLIFKSPRLPSIAPNTKKSIAIDGHTKLSQIMAGQKNELLFACTKILLTFCGLLYVFSCKSRGKFKIVVLMSVSQGKLGTTLTLKRPSRPMLFTNV